MARLLEVEDLERFVMVSDPQLSPLLDRVALVVTRVDGRRDDYSSTVWVVSRFDGKPTAFLSGEKDHSPRWSADGAQLLFVSKRGLREGEKGDGLWILPATGGEPRRVAEMKGGVEQPQWGADGRSIFFISAVGEDDENVRVVDRIPLWSDAVGFTYHQRKQLFVVDSVSGVVTRLTEDEVSVVCAAASSRGGKVAYACFRGDLDPRRMEVFVYDSASGKQVKVLEGFFVECLFWSPDDEYLGFLGSDLSSGYSTHHSVWLLPAVGGKPENLTAGLDRGCSRRTYYDLRSSYAGTASPVWDGGHVYFPVSDGARFNLHRISLEKREVEPVLTGGFSLEEFSVRAGVIAYTRVTATEPAEVWVRDGSSDRRLTCFNEGLLSTLSLSSPELFEFRASDGQMVEGWVLRPPGVAEDVRVPAVLDVHGGPKSKFGDALMFEHQLYAAKGYAVVYVNPRGSDGYSQEFGDIRGGWGGRDYADIMEAVDHLAASHGFIDSARLGVTGISYGGYMTDWIVTQTDRFKAAVSQNGICNLASFYGTTDIGYFFAPDQVGGDPWSNEKAYREMSPFTYAPRVTTPIMFVHSYEDYRCWIDQSIMFYTALKSLGKEARLVLFMQGSHGFRSTGKPSFRRKRLEHILGWFDAHLKEAGATG